MNPKEETQSSEAAEIIERFREKLERIATARGISFEEVLEEALAQGLERLKKKFPKPN